MGQQRAEYESLNSELKLKENQLQSLLGRWCGEGTEQLVGENVMGTSQKQLLLNILLYIPFYAL